jgi:hypothetical protein
VASGQESSSDFKHKSRESISLSCSHLNLRNARVLFMTKIHPVRNSQFMKAIRDVHSFFQEESFKIRSNQPVQTQCVRISHWRMNTESMLKIDSSNFFR